MKKVIVLLTAILSTQWASAHRLATGEYKGQALWKSVKDKGNYQVQTTIKAGRVETHYVLPDGQTRDWNFDLRETSSGFFDVVVRGAKVGAGYCLESALVCHYQITVGPTTPEESLVQDGKNLYRFGSKNEG